MNQELRDALTLKYQGDIAAAKANIKVYLNNPVGIGEHPDIVGAIDDQISIAAAADEKLNFLTNEIGW
jgi:hypothetical protein|tara:strand:- start:902 stop:1105 length:204 start_codon:yes stop_codon:yes gene_type:complete